jgi:hypothetical protein
MLSLRSPRRHSRRVDLVLHQDQQILEENRMGRAEAEPAADHACSSNSARLDAIAIQVAAVDEVADLEKSQQHGQHHGPGNRSSTTMKMCKRLSLKTIRYRSI